MYILPKNVEKILEIMKKFPNATNFELLEEGKNGIGSIINLKFFIEVNGVIGEFKVEISGIEDW